MPKAVEVYTLFLETPDAGKSSYLYAHYLRGKQGLQRPERSRWAALAAWLAGQDSKKRKRKKTQ